MKPFPDEGEYAEIATVGADNPGFDASVGEVLPEASVEIPSLPSASAEDAGKDENDNFYANLFGNKLHLIKNYVSLVWEESQNAEIGTGNSYNSSNLFEYICHNSYDTFLPFLRLSRWSRCFGSSREARRLFGSRRRAFKRRRRRRRR